MTEAIPPDSTPSDSNPGDSKDVDAAGKRLADAIRSLASTTASVFTNCIVDHVDTGGAPDGTDLVYIQVGPDLVTAPYLDSSPPGGSTVRVEFANGSPLIHGRVLGKSA